MGNSSAQTSLVIMAAGIGSRFGQGIKQLTRFGPGGEIIMDYSIYDAIAAGFDRVVFVIRPDLEEDFRNIIGNRIEKQIDVAYAFQRMEDLPGGFSVPEGRKKPWGTGQAILACRDIVKEPFCVINADDYYGKKAFSLIHDKLKESGGDKTEDDIHRICMAGFILENTLSSFGGVTRGICRVDEDGNLAGIDETKNIVRHEGGAAVPQDSGAYRTVDPKALVSMNMWGYEPAFMDELKEGFEQFLSKVTSEGNQLKAEYLLPEIVDKLLVSGRAKVSVLPTDDRWFGVTYQEDIPSVRESFLDLIQKGAYPEFLWGQV